MNGASVVADAFCAILIQITCRNMLLLTMQAFCLGISYFIYSTIDFHDTYNHLSAVCFLYFSKVFNLPHLLKSGCFTFCFCQRWDVCCEKLWNSLCM